MDIVKPRVRVDKKLQEQGIEVGFDYAAYYELSREAGQSRRDIKAHTIRYRQKKHSECMGVYSPISRTSSIFVGSCIKNLIKYWCGGDVRETFGPELANSLNAVTIHETGHHIDLSSRAFARQEITLIGSGITSLLALGMENPVLAVGTSSVLGGIMLRALAPAVEQRLTPYEQRPCEDFAYEFEKTFSEAHQVVNVTLSDEFFSTASLKQHVA